MPQYLTPSSTPQYLTPTRQSAPSAPAEPHYLTPNQPNQPAADSGISPWLAGAGVAALGAGAYALTRNPELAAKAVNAGSGALMDVRRASMLSGLAPLKSFLGNVGGSAYESIERGSMAPIREMLSPTTMRDAWDTFKAGPNYDAAGPANLEKGLSSIPGVKYLHPGRIMGAFDTAAQNALQRAGLTSDEAARSMLQTPLPKRVSSVLDSPVGNYLIPFRRTPINQFLEGMDTLKPSNLVTRGQKAALGTSIATGAATGAEADDPKSIALGTALSGRRGLPFAISAGIARALTTGAKGKGLEAIQGLSPISDYSLGEETVGPVMNPLGSIVPKPAAFSAVDYLRKLLGME